MAGEFGRLKIFSPMGTLIETANETDASPPNALHI